MVFTECDWLVLSGLNMICFGEDFCLRNAFLLGCPKDTWLRGGMGGGEFRAERGLVQWGCCCWVKDPFVDTAGVLLVGGTWVFNCSLGGGPFVPLTLLQAAWPLWSGLSVNTFNGTIRSACTCCVCLIAASRSV